MSKTVGEHAILESDGKHRIVCRQCGGWLEVTGDGALIKIGVTADAEAEAEAKLTEAVKDWRALLDAEGADRLGHTRI